MQGKINRLAIGGVSLLLAVCTAARAGEGKVTLERLEDEGKVRVEIDGKLFTEYIYKGQAKPILYPVIGPRDTPMTRNYPMKEVKGEARDHPHHRSLWFTHGDVNGISFWHEGKGAGKIVMRRITVHHSQPSPRIESTNAWVAPGGKEVCTDETTIRFSQDEDGAKIIDYHVVIHAGEQDVKLGDTKEGTMGIRTHPNLRLTNKGKAVTTANGHALNSEGHTDKALWGKRAKWVDYWGDIDGKTVGVAIFDHPQNPSHPTWWHARDYGLVAANPFGVHDFERKPKGTGDLVIKKGESLAFKYRFVFHEGDAKQAKTAERYEKFAAP